MPADIREILTLEVPVVVQIGERRMPLQEVLALTPGAIVELTKPADEELEVLVNNKAIGVGMAVKVGENFGVRLTYIGDLRERVASMGGAASGIARPISGGAAVAEQLLAG
jgi:flagellar motor switch protein FliN